MAQAVYERLGDRYGVIQAALTLGELSRRIGKYEESRQFCEQAVTVSREIGFQSGEADGHFRLGQVAVSIGDFTQAKHHQVAALALSEALDEQPLLLDTLYEIGGTLIQTGKPDDAVFLLVWLQSQPEVSAQRRREIATLLTEIGGGVITAASPAEICSQAEILRWVREILRS